MHVWDLATLGAGNVNGLELRVDDGGSPRKGMMRDHVDTVYRRDAKVNNQTEAAVIMDPGLLSATEKGTFCLCVSDHTFALTMYDRRCIYGISRSFNQ